MKRSVKITSRKTSSSKPIVVQSFGCEESFLTRWDCSHQLQQYHSHHSYRYFPFINKTISIKSFHRLDVSPILHRKSPQMPLISAEITAKQRIAEERIHLLKELPWKARSSEEKIKETEKEKKQKKKIETK